MVKLDSLGCDSAGCALYTALDETKDKDVTFTLYPNPARSVVYFNLRNTSDDFFEIDIYNAQGQLVLHKKQLNIKNTFPVFINHFQQGIYFVRIMAGEKVYTTKFVVNN